MKKLKSCNLMLSLVVAFVCVAGLAIRAQAAPMLPNQLLGDDVIGVLLIDANKAQPANLSVVSKAIFGSHANKVNTALGKWTAHREAFVRAGGAAMAFAYIDTTNNAGVANPVFLFSLRKDADKDAVIDLIKKVGGKDAKINTVGGWLAAYDRRLAFPWLEHGKPARVALFQKALEPIKNCPAVIAFVPSRKLRLGAANKQVNFQLARGIRELKRDLVGLDVKLQSNAVAELRTRIAKFEKLLQFDKDLLAFNQQLIKSESISVSLSTGAEPVLQIRTLMATDKDAQDLIGLQLPLAKAIAPIRDSQDFRDMHVDMIAKMFAYDAILRNSIPQQTGKIINIKVSGQPLIELATTAASGLVKMQAESATVKSINHMKVLAFALLAYARDHQGRFPPSLEELGRLKFVDNLSEVLTNPRTGAKQGYMYIRPRYSLNHLVKERLTGKTPFLYEVVDGKPIPGSLIAYISGKVMRPKR